MHPYGPVFSHIHHTPHMRHMFHRGPSRILWFFLGGAAFMWFNHHKERRVKDWENGHQVPSCRRFGWDVQMRRVAGEEGMIREDPREGQFSPITRPARAEQRMPQSSPVIWEEEKEKMRQVTQQASETVADVAEVGLDSVLSALESLKMKVSEYRALRDRARPLETDSDSERRV